MNNHAGLPYLVIIGNVASIYSTARGSYDASQQMCQMKQLVKPFFASYAFSTRDNYFCFLQTNRVFQF